jgi:Cytochrome c7 and related cytochrome c
MNPRTVLVAAVALAAAGCVARGGKPEAAENPPFTIPHSVHVDAGLACTVCHADVAQATAVGPRVHVALPQGDAAKACADCHDKPPPPPPPRRVEQAISFSHAAHLSLVKGDCTRCHKALVEAGQATAPVPSMSTCTSCHNHSLDYAQARCQPCHVDLKRYPLKPVADFRHEGDFLRTHGKMAAASATSCAACHDQTSCAQCHATTTRPVKPDIQWPERVESSFIHRGDFVSRHVIERNADPASCARCHGTAFCQACHTEQGISPLTSALPGGRTPHPPGWNAGNVHGPAARANIGSCAGCHDQGARSTCVNCHRNVNPHPPGYGSRHDKTSDVAKNSMCRTCHLQ